MDKKTEKFDYKNYFYHAEYEIFFASICKVKKGMVKMKPKNSCSCNPTYHCDIRQ